MIIQSHHDDSSSVYFFSDVPVLGFLTESLNSLYQSNIWNGASDAATRLGYSILCFAGGSLSQSSWNEYEPQRNIIYNHIDKKYLKGIIIAGSLGNFISGSEFRRFYNQFTEIPLVCLGPEIPSVPTVIVDNTRGMRELISHLVEHHHCTRIAFVRGPEGNQEAEERLRIFREVLVEHGLTPDPDLILPGDFSRDAGANAVEYLLAGEHHFDALVGANDDTALGALKAFQEHHVRVPDEVLVVGFDDIEESSFSAPPLTTVRQPLYEMGSRAVEVVHNCIQGQKIKGTIIVPASLVTRQSCGCFRHYEVNDHLFCRDSNEITDSQRCILKEETETVMARLAEHAVASFDTALLSELIEIYIDELSGNKTGSFIPAINKIAWKLASAGGDTMGLYHIIEILRQFALARYEESLPETVESLFLNAYTAIADSATRAQANRRLASERQATILRSAGQAIASAFDLVQLLGVIAAELGNLEIEGCYLSLYDRFENPGRHSRLHLVLALRDGKRFAVDSADNTFSVPRLSPDNVIRITDPHSLLVEPLYFRDEQIGIIVFEVRRCRNGQTYEILQQHISSALKGTLLMKQVQEQAAALEAANEQLQKLRDAEHAYLKAIKHELELGRDIQTSFLPRSIPEVPGWEVVNYFQPAREVSGDFYDVFVLPDGEVMLTICDVSGKDVSAALYMALIRTLIRALAEQALGGASEPLDAVSTTNRYLINHHHGNNGRYMYATLFMGLLDPEAGTIQYINAGHNPAAVIAADGTIRSWVNTTGPAVGIIPEAEFGIEKVIIGPDETFFLFTDGVTEARSPDGMFFSKQRLSALLSGQATSAAELITRIEDAVREHSAGDPPFDDITMLAVRKTAER